LTVTIAGENAKFWIATVFVATGVSWPKDPPGPPARGIDIPGIDIPGITCWDAAGVGLVAGGAAAVLGLVKIPTAIAAPARVAIPAVTAGNASWVVNWRMVINPDPAR
jgi:hypothetical protein